MIQTLNNNLLKKSYRRCLETDWVSRRQTDLTKKRQDKRDCCSQVKKRQTKCWRLETKTKTKTKSSLNKFPWKSLLPSSSRMNDPLSCQVFSSSSSWLETRFRGVFYTSFSQEKQVKRNQVLTVSLDYTCLSDYSHHVMPVTHSSLVVIILTPQVGQESKRYWFPHLLFLERLETTLNFTFTHPSLISRCSFCLTCLSWHITRHTNTLIIETVHETVSKESQPPLTVLWITHDHDAWSSLYLNLKCYTLTSPYHHPLHRWSNYLAWEMMVIQTKSVAAVVTNSLFSHLFFFDSCCFTFAFLTTIFSTWRPPHHFFSEWNGMCFISLSFHSTNTVDHQQMAFVNKITHCSRFRYIFQGL